MGSTTIGIKVDDDTKARLKAAADGLGRSPHWLAKQGVLAAITEAEGGDAGDAGQPAPADAPFLDLARAVRTQSPLRARITAATRRPETECLPLLLAEAAMPPAARAEASAIARTLVEKLRASGQTAPILMLSANIGDDAARTSSDAGHNDAIAKPFAINQLLDKIAAHLGVEWLTDEPVSKRRAPRKPRPKVGQRPRSPGPDHLKELFDLGQIGHVRGIDLKLRQLAEEPANAPLIELLRARIEVFDLEGYRQVLESVGEHDR